MPWVSWRNFRGYPIEVMGDRSKLAGKKITLNTGLVPFWKAFDVLSDEAGLVERVQENSTVRWGLLCGPKFSLEPLFSNS